MSNVIDKFVNDFCFLSNFFPSTFKFENIVWKTVEHAYQATKTDNAEQKFLIQSAKTPYIAKKLGKCVVLKENWDSVKFSVMQQLVHLKFQNPILSELLLLTGDAELIEGNTWNDRYWGVCRGVGENNLGKILMQERHNIKLSKEQHEP